MLYLRVNKHKHGDSAKFGGHVWQVKRHRKLRWWLLLCSTFLILWRNRRMEVTSPRHCDPYACPSPGNVFTSWRISVELCMASCHWRSSLCLCSLVLSVTSINMATVRTPEVGDTPASFNVEASIPTIHLWRRRGRMYSSYLFMTSALDGGEWSASRPGRTIPLEKGTPGTHCTGGWVGPRAGLDTQARGDILCLCRGSNPDRPVFQPAATHYTDWATPAHVI
jgi:hypothetical protein